MKIAVFSLLIFLSAISLSTCVPNAGNTNIPATGVTLNKTSTGIVVGNTEQLYATIAPPNATNQIAAWSSSNDLIASVSTSGLVTAIAYGSATVRVTTKDGGYFDDCAVMVSNICGNTIQDGGFETGTPNAFWSESSTNFGTPICSTAVCGSGIAGPYNGTYWAWFGGANNETGILSQTMEIPIGANILRFYLALPVCESGIYDTFTIRIDGVQVFYTNGSDAQCGVTTYSLHNVDVTAFADGAQHTLEIKGTTDSSNPTSFMVDVVQFVCN
jgi:hypothetical protein